MVLNPWLVQSVERLLSKLQSGSRLFDELG
jgi:hypothetical protein